MTNLSERELELVKLVWTTALEVKQHAGRYRYMTKANFAQSVLQRVINELVPGITVQDRDVLMELFDRLGQKG